MKRRENVTLNAARWTAYTAAGAAAALVGQNTAEAAITVIDVDTVLADPAPGDGYFGVAHVQTFGASGASFTFLFADDEIGPNTGVLTITGGGNLAIAGFTAGAYNYPSNLAYGADLATQSFGVAAGARGDLAWGSGYSNSQFVNTGGFIGFSFDLGGGTQFGWAELELINGAPENDFKLTRVAWGDVGDRLLVGQTAVPAPGALAVLALGACGIGGWRRQRKG